MVVTIDPHLKRADDYRVYNEAKDVADFIVKTKDGPTGVELGCENAAKHGVLPDAAE